MNHGEGMIFEFDRRFKKAFLKLSVRLQKQAHEKMDIFMRYPNHQALHLHKSHGEQQEFWSFWVNYEYRIIFVRRDLVITFFDIGTHKIYR